MKILMPSFENILVSTYLVSKLIDCARATEVKCVKIFESKTEDEVSTRLAW
jgi:hypothetical protein